MRKDFQYDVVIITTAMNFSHIKVFISNTFGRFVNVQIHQPITVPQVGVKTGIEHLSEVDRHSEKDIERYKNPCCVYPVSYLKPYLF